MEVYARQPSTAPFPSPRAVPWLGAALGGLGASAGRPACPGALGRASRVPWGPWPGAGQVEVVQGRLVIDLPCSGPAYPGPPLRRANEGPAARENCRGVCAVPGCPPGPSARGAAVLVWPLCGRESIFLFSHTNEFCGKSKVAPEAGVAWFGLKVGRRVCERGQPRKRLPARCSKPSGQATASPAPVPVRRLARPTLETGLNTPVPYLAGTFRGLLLGVALRPQQPWPWRVDWIDPTPTKPAALCARTAYWGCPAGGGRRNTLPPPKDGLCGRLAAGKSYHKSSGRQPPRSGRRMGETARRVLLLGPLGHTTR